MRICMAKEWQSEAPLVSIALKKNIYIYIDND